MTKFLLKLLMVYIMILGIAYLICFIKNENVSPIATDNIVNIK